MKRGLAFALAALALVAGNAAVQAADIDLSLNLRYTDPAAPAEGGLWFLMAKTNTAGANTGIAGLSVYLSGINDTGVVWGNGTAVGGYPVVTGATLGANVQTPGNVPFVSTTAGVTNLVYGQDLVTKTLTIGEGTGTPGVIATDVLRNTATWNNSTLIMSGSFGATRPAFATSGANSTDGNVYNAGGTAVDATISTTVRGDSLNTLNLEAAGGTEGLRIGDRNRDFAVNISTDILPALAAIGLPNQGWDNGDFNNSGTVNISTDILPALAQIGLPGLPPAIAAVPEPASVGLALFGVAAMGIFRKRFA